MSGDLALPNLLVIGAQKAGTSSLHAYLNQHPEIAMSRPKELDFFSGPGWNWERGVDWYASHFSEPAAIRGESSPSYTAYPYVQTVPERIRSLIPDAKLVYMVRDPIDRMVSQFLHHQGRGYERRSLEEVFSHPDFHASGYVAKSRYHMQLERYLEHYPQSQILVVAQEDLLDDRTATMGTILRFLGVDDSFVSERWKRLHNPALEHPLQSALNRWLPRRAVRPVVRRRWFKRIESRLVRSPESQSLRPELHERLAEYLSDDVEALRALTGQSFASWSV